MNTQGMVSTLQILSLIAVNLVGIALVGVVLVFFNKILKRPDGKILVSFGAGFVALGIMFVAFLDVGIYLWIDSGNIRAVFFILPLSLCVFPILFLVTVIGTYIQLSYGEMIRAYLNSVIARKGFQKKSQ